MKRWRILFFGVLTQTIIGDNTGCYIFFSPTVLEEYEGVDISFFIV